MPATLALVLMLAFFSASQVCAQNQPYNPNGRPYSRAQTQNPGGPPQAGDPGSPELNAKQLDTLNAARQKSLVSDTQKLVKLTAELNAQINSADSAKLTDDQLRMVGEIEKLARSIREKMCTSVNGVPQFMMPGPSLVPPSLR